MDPPMAKTRTSPHRRQLHCCYFDSFSSSQLRSLHHFTTAHLPSHHSFSSFLILCLCLTCSHIPNHHGSHQGGKPLPALLEKGGAVTEPAGMCFDGLVVRRRRGRVTLCYPATSCAHLELEHSLGQRRLPAALVIHCRLRHNQNPS